MPSTLSAAEDLNFYIGAYTSTGGSLGIYHSTLNVATGEITAPRLAVESANPSFLAPHPNGKFLYAVHETPQGKVSAYAIDAPARLRWLNTESSQGDSPCHLSLDASCGHLLVANYGDGVVASLPIKADGSLAPATAVVKNSGHGPKPQQKGPHAHWVSTDPQNRVAYVCDLGTDQVLIYGFDAANGSLTRNDPPGAMLAPGSGPRHFALHPSGAFAFVNNELGNSVSAFERHTTTGALTELQTLSTLPPGESLANRSTAEIACHPSGKWLYVSNRGHDSVAVFEIGGDGKLTLVEIRAADVAEPRGFAIDPSGRWLVIAGQKSGDLTAHTIDSATGRLGPSGNKVSLKSPVCVVFAQP